MNLWNIISYAAWVVGVALVLWMLFDAIKVSREHDESYLMSSREGEDVLMEKDEENRHG